MKRTSGPTLASLLFLALYAPSSAATDLLLGDSAAPGMTPVVQILRSEGGFSDGDLISTDCGDIIVAPSIMTGGYGDPSDPVTGGVLSTVFIIPASAPTGDCEVSVNKIPLSPLGEIDNFFHLVTPETLPEDGDDGSVDGVITLPASMRSAGGVLVLESLNLPSGVVLSFGTEDPFPSTPGNEAFLPVTLYVAGDALIDGEVEIDGASGAATTGGPGGDGGAGGVGGGGGGGGGPEGNLSGSEYGGIGGDGFAGGGAGYGSSAIVSGGIGTGGIWSADSGGANLFELGGGASPSGQTGRAGTGASGNFFGTGGVSSESFFLGGLGGFGGGGAGAVNTRDGGGGGGGFGTNGEGYLPTDACEVDSCEMGGAGQRNGYSALVPLSGGSGGAGGQGRYDYTSGSTYTHGGGGGGGGGGALAIVSWGSMGGSGLVRVNGGEGGDGASTTSSVRDAGGGGGSGGAVFLASTSFESYVSLEAHGGEAGTTSGYPIPGGAGGEGRLRLDGRPFGSLSAGPTLNYATYYEGCAVIGTDGGLVSVASSTSCNYTIIDDLGALVAEGTLTDTDAVVDFSSYLSSIGPGSLYILLDRNGVYSPVGVATITDPDDDDIASGEDNCVDSPNPDQTDSDGDGLGDLCDPCTDADTDTYGDSSLPGWDSAECDADCDDSDAAIHPGAEEIWYDGVDSDCDGASDYDQDRDGHDSDDFHGDDCDDLDPSTYLGAEEVYDGADNDCNGEIDDLDSDEDGIEDPDEEAIGTDRLAPDTDGDGILDGDEVGDISDPRDSDDDSAIDPLDPDDDNDGIPTLVEHGWDDPDADGDSTPNHLDLDSDEDGHSDTEEGDESDGAEDTDLDGTPDFLDPDDDGDGLLTRDEDTLVGSDPYDADTDDDTVLDGVEAPDPSAPRDSDGDSVIDVLDPDDDDDGIPTATEQDQWSTDADEDGTPNYLDLDSDDDGLPDTDEGTVDLDGDSIPDFVDPFEADDTGLPKDGYFGGGGGCDCATSSGSGRDSLAILLGLLAFAGLSRRRGGA